MNLFLINIHKLKDAYAEKIYIEILDNNELSFPHFLYFFYNYNCYCNNHNHIYYNKKFQFCY